MFNFKAIVLLVLAVAVGGGAAVFAQRWLQQQQAGLAIAAEGEKTVDIIVAAREIPHSQPIEEMHLRTVAWPEGAVPADSFRLKEDLIGKLVTQTILPGEPLLAARVVDKLAGSRLSALISPNKRAVTVRVNDVAGVAGFLLPGNRVDVLATRINAQRRAVTDMVLQNIKVLAIDQRANPDKDDPIVVRAVTLETDVEEARKLTGAVAEGTIQLVLRNPDDEEMTIRAKPVVIAKPAARRRDTSRDITIIRGTSVDRSKVKL